MKNSILLSFVTLLLVGCSSSASLFRGPEVQKAYVNMKGEQYQTAVNAIQEVIEQNPNNAANYYYAGMISLNIGQPDQARTYFEKGIAVNSLEPLNYVGQGYLALNGGDEAKAQSFFDNAISLISKGNKALVYNQIANALLHAKTKDAEKALTYLNKAELVQKSGDYMNEISAQTKKLMGDAYLALGEAGDAVNSYENAIRLNPQLTARLRNVIGELYLSARNTKAAMEQFQKAKQANPNYAPVYRNLGEIYFTYENNVTKAKEMYQKYLELSDISTGAKDRYAAFLYVSKDFEKAIPAIREVLNRKPDDLVMNRLLGYSYFKTEQYPKAVDAFEKYFNIVTEDEILATDYSLYGKSLIQTGNNSLAIDYMTKAIEQDSTNLLMVEDFAQTLTEQKKYESAAALYTILLEQKNELSTNDYYSAGRAFMRAKMYEKAIPNFAKVIELEPDNYIGYYMMALTQQYLDPQGEKGLAKKYYEKLIELTSDKPDENKNVLITAYQYLATYYTRDKKLEKALELWNKINTIDPGNANAQKFFEYYKSVQEYNAAVEKQKQMQQQQQDQQ